MGRVTTGVLVKTDAEESLVVVESIETMDRDMGLLYAVCRVIHKIFTRYTRHHAYIGHRVADC